MASTTTQLIADVRMFARDDDATLISDSKIVSFLNEAYRDLSARLRLFDKETTGTTSAGFTIAFPASPSLVEIVSLELGTTGADDVEFVAADTWDAYKEDAASIGHTLGRIFNDVIELYPTPTTATAYVLRWHYIPAALTGGSETHLLPIQLERKLKEYAKFMTFTMLGRPDEASVWLQLYSDGLPTISTAHERKFPGPFQIARMLNIWDADPDATHV